VLKTKKHDIIYKRMERIIMDEFKMAMEEIKQLIIENTELMKMLEDV
jgi:hypothetical protein